MTPSRWLRLEVRSSSSGWSEDLVYALTERLIPLGSGGVQQKGGGCITFFPEPPNPADFQARVETAVAAVISDAECAWSWQPHEEWADVWRQGFTAHDFGERLRVAPPWITDARATDREVVLIDPGVAFGTAEHGSTRGCLTLLEPRVPYGGSVLDVGAGSGVLAIAALRLGANRAECVEIDAVACEALRENAVRNDVQRSISVHPSAFTDTSPPGPFELVLCNMVLARIRPLLGALAVRVVPGGCMILGGCTLEEVEDLRSELETIPGTWSWEARVDDDGWVAVALRRD